MRYWKIIILLMLVTTPLVNAFDIQVDVSKPDIQLLAEPVRSAFQAQLFADEWNDKSVDLEKTANDKIPADAKTSFRKKSRIKAIALSAILPGAGQYYMGQKRKATYFFVAEAISIIGYLSYDLAAKWKREDMIQYGGAYSGAAMTGKSDDFYNMMGYYDNNEHYNSEGRVGDPLRPFYPDDDEYHWQWESAEQKAIFKNIKDREGQLLQRSKFMIGLAVVNRIVSIIEVAISTKNISSRSSDEFSQQSDSNLEFSINPTSTNQQVALTWHLSGF